MTASLAFVRNARPDFGHFYQKRASNARETRRTARLDAVDAEPLIQQGLRRKPWRRTARLSMELLISPYRNDRNAASARLARRISTLNT
jgi:hypothetical protein